MENKRRNNDHFDAMMNILQSIHHFHLHHNTPTFIILLLWCSKDIVAVVVVVKIRDDGRSTTILLCNLGRITTGSASIQWLVLLLCCCCCCRRKCQNCTEMVSRFICCSHEKKLSAHNEMFLKPGCTKITAIGAI